MRNRLAAILAGLATALGGAIAFGWGNYTTPVSFVDGGTTILLDAGPRLSTAVMLQNPLAGVTCTGNGLGVVTLLGSNDAAVWTQTGTPIAMDGGKNAWVWDPVTSGLEYLAIMLDGGSVATTGSISCLVTQKGTAP